jgi:hypothetical protein
MRPREAVARWRSVTSKESLEGPWSVSGSTKTLDRNVSGTIPMNPALGPRPACAIAVRGRSRRCRLAFCQGA